MYIMKITIILNYLKYEKNTFKKIVLKTKSNSTIIKNKLKNFSNFFLKEFHGVSSYWPLFMPNLSA